MSVPFFPRFDPFNPEHTRHLNDVEMPGMDWSTPNDLLKHLGMPEPPAITPKEVKRQAKFHRDCIWNDWTRVKAIMERHERTIYSRWQKKSAKQRRQVLSAVWPNMSQYTDLTLLHFEQRHWRIVDQG